jgi:TM2 domain-containing membrane protein YozV
MNCAYHIHNAAVVNCNGCGKPLCPSCDHRIKGFPFCQDCIVTGVELLRNRNQSSSSAFVKKQVSPFVSTVLSLICPGLGAAYNGQTSKALVHFAVFVGLFQLAILSRSPIFVFGFLGMWLFTAVDSWRTARLIRAGLTPDGAQDWIVERFKGNPKIWGILLTVLGGLFFLQMFLPLRQLTRAILPVMLIGLGVYLLRDYVFKRRVDNVYSRESDLNNFRSRGEAPNLGIVGKTDFRTGDFGAGDDYETQVKSWRAR